MDINKALGLGGGGRKFKTVTVDNGDNIKGDNSTDQFVIKSKDQEGNTKREALGTKLEGVVLMARARVNSKYGTNPSWYSSEFNPLDKDEAITVYFGDNKEKKVMSYNQIKEANQVDGRNNYTYTTVLYLKIDDEVVKVLLKGASQGNWFKFQEDIKTSILGFITTLQIAKGEKGFNEVLFGKGEVVDINVYLEEAKNLLSSQPKQLTREASQPAQIAQNPQDEVTIPELTDADNPGEQEEIPVEEIPF